MVTTRRKPSMMNEAMANGNAKKSVEDGHGPAVDPKRRRITFDSDETANNCNEDSSSSLSIPSVINTAAIKKKKGKKKKGDDDLSSSSTPISIELQKIVDTMPLSRDALGKIKDLMRHSVMDQCLTALKKVYDLTNTQDETIMKNFIKHEGVSKVIAFLKLAVDDGNTSPGKEIQTKCFEVAADVLFNVCSCSPFDDAVKQWNRKKNAMDIIEHDGVRILLLAHRELKQKGEQYPLCNLDAAKSIWSLISLLSNGGNFTILAKERVRALFDLGVELVNDMKYTKLSKGVDMMGDVFETMKHIIVFNNEESGAKGIVTGRDIEESNILSECCIMFGKNSTISRSTDAVEQVIAFLYYSHCRELFKNASDYEKLLPICLLGVTMGPLLRMKFRKRAMMIIYKACMLVDKKKIKRASVKKIFTDLIISPSTEIDEEDERDVFPPLVHYYGDIINQIEEKESGDEGGDEKSEDEEEW